MHICHRCDLCQMRDTDHLMVSGDQCQLFGYHLCSASADTTVDLIKDQRLNLLLVCHHGFDRQHDPGKLTSGCRILHRTQRLTRIGGDHKTHFILPGYHIIFQQTEIEFKLYIQKIQIHQSLLHLFCKTLCRFLSDDSEVFCFFLQLFFAGGKTAFSLRQVSFVVFKYCKTLLFFFTVCLDFLDRITVFRLQMVDQIKPLLCLFQRFFIDIQLICISGDLPVKII